MTQPWAAQRQAPAADGKGKETLYVFIDAMGNYIASNTTGKL